MSGVENLYQHSDDSVRPATIRDLLTLIDALNREGVPYLLIGGFSLIVHGFSRGTRDIDLLVPASSEAGKKIQKVLLLLPDQVAQALDPKWFDEGQNFRVTDEYVVDIMLNANGQTYETLLPYLETITVEGVPINVPSLDGLLKTKMTGREKDRIDEICIRHAYLRRAKGCAAERTGCLTRAIDGVIDCRCRKLCTFQVSVTHRAHR